MKKYINLILLTAFCTAALAQTSPKTEEDYYKIVTLPVPEGVELEVGGVAVIPDGRLAVATRRGEVWMINNPYMLSGTAPTFSRFARGLHEPLGLEFIDNKLWATQRGEVTILHDKDNNGKADDYESFYRFPLSGNYHQYSYGPLPLPDGNMVVTLNLDWIGKGASQSKWRGWMLKLSPDGKMTPWATGLRSPAGFGVLKNGEIFYAENQGDWVGSGRVTHLEQGDFAGNPAGLLWSEEDGSPVKLKPEDIPDTGEPMYDVAQNVEGLKPPAVWFPHTLMGISTADIIENRTDGRFGPFEGQLFVGDQGHSKIMRMSLEKINGVYQGACYAFREGFQSGILRMRWGIDGSMFVGMTSRGWAATGKDKFGVQRLEWTGAMPFEINEVKSMPDGFEISFTQPVDAETARNVANMELNSFTYKYHHTYGSPTINIENHAPKAIRVAEDKMSMRVVIDGMRLGYIHEIKLPGIKNANGNNLLHDFAYYTLNQINDKPAKVDVKRYAVAVVSTAKMDHSMHDMATEVAAAPTTAKRTNEMPKAWNGKADQTVTIGTVPGLKFDTKQIEVKAGSNVKLIFNNNDDMLHNLLIVKPQTVDKVGTAALNLGLQGETKGYVPNMDEVLYHTWILRPETAEAIYFTAPTTPGNYTYVCTFPGHYTLMQGTLVVK
jgi:azurin/glucose/arabinose dehydrogenase